MAEQKFHHGNLRAALLDLAEQALERHGYEALSLRDLAENLGVTRAAPYRHFRSKTALLLALAERGVEALADHYRAAQQMVGTPSDRLRAACRAYLDFARDRPEIFRLIFVSDIDWQASSDTMRDRSAFGIFEWLVGDSLGITIASDRRNAALVCWCIIHGFAMLRMNHRLERLADVDAVERTVLAMTGTGFLNEHGAAIVA